MKGSKEGSKEGKDAGRVGCFRFPFSGFPFLAAALSTEDQSARLQVYGSLLILIVLAAFGIGKLLTLGASICKMAAACCRRDTYLYQELNTEASSEVPPQQHHTPLWARISLHFFCAALALLAADFGLLSIQCGVCWEIYVLWLLPFSLCIYLVRGFCSVL